MKAPWRKGSLPLEVSMTTTKMCPMMSNQTEKQQWVGCLGSTCAWWYDRSDKCGALELVYELVDINLQIRNLVDLAEQKNVRE